MVARRRAKPPEKAGLNAIAVQNPLTSFADDVAATKRAVALQDGPMPRDT